MRAKPDGIAASIAAALKSANLGSQASYGIGRRHPVSGCWAEAND
jgi:hypothetical protein